MATIPVGVGETFTTIQAAIDAAEPDDIVVVAPGTYDYVLIATSTCTPGTAGHLVTLRSATKWGARIVAGAHVGINVAIGMNYVVLDGFDITTTGDYDGITINGDHCEIRNCWIHGAGRNGILAGSTSTPVLIESNLIESCGADTQDHGIYSTLPNAVIRNNIVRNSAGSGIHVYKDDHSISGVSVYGNISYDNAKAAILVEGLGIAGGACGNVVANNVAAQKIDSVEPTVDLRGCDGAVVANNIIIASTAYGSLPAIQESVGGISNVYTNNQFYVRSKADNTHAGAVDQTTNLLTNPGFETATGDDFTWWVEGTGVTADTTDEDPVAGAKCCKIANTDTTQSITTAACMTVGSVYTLIVRVKGSVAGKTFRMYGGTDPYATSRRTVTLHVTYQTVHWTFVATHTSLSFSGQSSGTYDIFIDNCQLLQAYGPEVHSIDQNMFWPRYGSRVIDAGEPTYKPAADFWGTATGAAIQIGAIPYTKELYPRTMMSDPFDAVKLNRRWWDWRRKQQLLK